MKRILFIFIYFIQAVLPGAATYDFDLKYDNKKALLHGQETIQNGRRSDDLGIFPFHVHTGE